jgi:hypothetical protein
MDGVIAWSPDSILATVFRAMRIRAASSFCVSPIAARILFNPFGVTIHKVANHLTRCQGNCSHSIAPSSLSGRIEPRRPHGRNPFALPANHTGLLFIVLA